MPECYHVKNVGPIETKISNFNEDTLFFIFYANAGDVTQHLAAQELYVPPPLFSEFFLVSVLTRADVDTREAGGGIRSCRSG